MYVYLNSEPGFYTVGFYGPNAEWHAESDWDTDDEAADRVHYLNGSAGTPAKAPELIRLPDGTIARVASILRVVTHWSNIGNTRHALTSVHYTDGGITVIRHLTMAKAEACRDEITGMLGIRSAGSPGTIARS